MLAEVCGVLEGEVFSVRKIRNKLTIKKKNLQLREDASWQLALPTNARIA